MRPPCDRFCQDRTAECKRSCEKWAEYELWYFEQHKEKEIQYGHDADYFSVVFENIRKNQSKGVKR